MDTTLDAHTIHDALQLVRMAVMEDLGRGHDLTTVALVPRDAQGAADIVARAAGIAAGLPLAKLIVDEMQLRVEAFVHVADGDEISSGTRLISLGGSARDLLTAERTILNFLGRLCGVATYTRRFVDAISGTRASIFDTRKTTPGWRRLEKYAVRCGGGSNHRFGLFDAVLIKDNHLAFTSSSSETMCAPDRSVLLARQFLREFMPDDHADIVVQVEVDTLEQLSRVLSSRPDIILLDNMNHDQLRKAVAMRDSVDPRIELEASGGVTLATVRTIAETGVERISVGGLTHSAPSLDLGMDWSVPHV